MASRVPPEVPDGPHQPERPAFSRNSVKWGCGGCSYWTGYASEKRARAQIVQHCTAMNAREATS